MNLYQRIRLWNRACRYLRKSEADECRFTCDCIESGQFVLDIGAHKAAYAYWMARIVGPGGRVYAFEPQPVLVRYLQSFAKSCRYQNVQVCPVALSDKRREGKLLVPQAHLGWATLEFTESSAGHTLLSVPVETLDEYLDSIGAKRPISFVKCDVELHELAVFRGGRRLLEKDRPVLLFESLPLMKLRDGGSPTFQFLQEMGYQGYFFFEKELVPLKGYRSSHHRLTNHQTQNYVFVHPQVARLTGFRLPYSLDRHCGRWLPGREDETSARPAAA